MEDDVVNTPAHYTQGSIEPIDYITGNQMDFLSGNIIKYVTRHRYKGNPLQDLEKAEFYLKRLIQETRVAQLRGLSQEEGR
jgi:hypothetical protein